jgi:hypothetical protein
VIKNKTSLSNIYMEVTSKSTITCIMRDFLLEFLTLEDGTDSLSWKAGKELPLLAA